MSHFGVGVSAVAGTVTIRPRNILTVLHFLNLAKCGSITPHSICQLLWGLISIAELEMEPTAEEDCPYFFLHTLLVGQFHALT